VVEELVVGMEGPDGAESIKGAVCCQQVKLDNVAASPNTKQAQRLASHFHGEGLGMRTALYGTDKR
jgi:hypothetical protein